MYPPPIPKFLFGAPYPGLTGRVYILYPVSSYQFSLTLTIFFESTIVGFPSVSEDSVEPPEPEIIEPLPYPPPTDPQIPTEPEVEEEETEGEEGGTGVGGEEEEEPESSEGITTRPPAEEGEKGSPDDGGTESDSSDGSMKDEAAEPLEPEEL